MYELLSCIVFQSQEHGSEISTRKDVVIVNEEKKLLLLTLWNQFDEKEGNMLANLIESGPLIFGLSLKVTTFNSLSLTTRTSSCVLINPPVIEDLKMNEWYNENKNELQDLFKMRSYKNTDLLLPYPKEEDIVSVARATSSLNNLKTAWIRSKTSAPLQDRSLWYTACANCKKPLEADITWVVTCPSCRLEYGVEVIMSRITTPIEDETVSIPATLCTLDAEKIMPFTAVQLQEADKYGLDFHDDIVNSVQQHTIVAFIRCYEATFNGQPQMNVSVVKCHESEAMLPPPILDSSSERGGGSKSTLDVATEATSNKGEHVFNPSASSKSVKRPMPSSKETPSANTFGLPATENTSESVLDNVTQAPSKRNEQESSPSECSQIVKRSLPLSTEDPCVKANDMPKQRRGTPLSVKTEIGVGSQTTHKSQTKKTQESFA